MGDNAFNVLELEADDKRWDELVRGAAQPDVYYLSDYARAYEAAGHGRACGLLVTARNVRILAPLLERSFVPGDGSEEVRDAYSPYGYGGLLVDGSPSQADIKEVVRAIRGWATARGLISCVLRLHPLLRQAQMFHDLDAGAMESRPGNQPDRWRRNDPATERDQGNPAFECRYFF